MIQRRVFVTGRVQGVGYRAATFREAARHALQGYVRNLPDGRVEAVFMGKASDVHHMLSWCTKGPVIAQVESLQVLEEIPDTTLSPFAITS